MSIKMNTYNLIAHGPSEIGNLLVYLCLFALIAILVLSIWILFFGLFISHVQLERLLIISATIIHLISLFKMKNNQITIPSTNNHLLKLHNLMKLSFQ